MVHAREMSGTELWSIDEEELNGISEERFRCISPGGEHSIAWILFHLARIEDITMNILVVGTLRLSVSPVIAGAGN